MRLLQQQQQQQHRITIEALSLIPHSIIHLVPPSASDCEPHTCRWRTTVAASGDFHAYAATIIIIILCAIICALVLHGAIRCFLRNNNNNNNTTTLPSAQPQLQLHHLNNPKPPPEAVPVPLSAAPMRVFAPGMKLSGAVAECAICLTEFVAGEEIRVLEICQHGFHVLCIEKWLFSHSSCPTCRAPCIPPMSEKSKAETETEDGHRNAARDPPEGFHSV